jgi:hypothetical protein
MVFTLLVLSPATVGEPTALLLPQVKSMTHLQPAMTEERLLRATKKIDDQNDKKYGSKTDIHKILRWLLRTMGRASSSAGSGCTLLN